MQRVPDDQIFLAGITAETAYYAMVPAGLASAMVSTFRQHATEWRGERATGSPQSLRAYLRENKYLS